MSLLTPIMKRLHGPVYARRLEVLTRLIRAQLEPNDRLLDVGCGGGALAHSVAQASRAEAVEVAGLEKFPRGGEPIPVEKYEGGRFPYADGSFDVVLLADVLHHEEDEGFLLREARRVARRLVIVKDHQIEGFLAYPRICLIDWAANAPYGVKCLFRYHSAEGWIRRFREEGLVPVAVEHQIKLYPQPYEFLFGGRLQIFAALQPAK